METLAPTEKSTSKRKDRYHRVHAAKRRPIMADHPNHVEILLALAPFDELLTGQVQAQLPHRSEQCIIRRLADLHNHGFIGRTDKEHRNYLMQNAHWLLEKGYKHLASLGYFPETIAGNEKGELRKEDPHTLMINNLLASIYAGAGPRFVALAHKRLPLDFDISYTYPSGKMATRKGFLRPDAIFGIRHGDLINYYLVECENTSPKMSEAQGLDRSCFLRKALAYGDILFNRKSFKELLGIRKLRVLVTAPTEALLKGKMDVIQKLYGATDTFIFCVVPRNGKMTSRFTTPYYRVGNPSYSLDLGV